MRPALYYPWVYLKGGAERVLVELVRRSEHDWTLYTNHFEPESTYPEFAGLNVVRLPDVSVRRTIASVAKVGAVLLTQRLDLGAHSGLLVLSEGLGNLIAMRSRVPTSCLCLTPLKVVYDPVTRERFFAGRRKPQYALAFAAYRAVDGIAWKRYRRVFCISNEVRRRLLLARLVPDDRLEVTHLGMDAGRYSATGEREPFFLVPGRMMWQKNIELVIAAWRRFKPDPSNTGFRLVVAGMVDAKSRPYLERLRADAGGRSDIEFVVSPTDGELLRLYQRSHAVVFPPPNEDFGLVPLEGMACGKPILATDRGGARETVVDGVTGLLRPDTIDAFASGLATLAEAGEDALSAFATHARARASEFPWSRFVRRIDEHVEELSELRGAARLPVSAANEALAGVEPPAS